MTQEGQFSPPVQDNGTNPTNPFGDDGVQTPAGGVFGGDGVAVTPSPSLDPFAQDTVHVDNSPMPDFGMPHEQQSVVVEPEFPEFTPSVPENTDLPPVPEFNPTMPESNPFAETENKTEVASPEDTVQPVVEEERVEEVKNGDEESEVKIKFDVLAGAIQKVYSLRDINDESYFRVLGSDNDTVRVDYDFSFETDDGVPLISVKKLELDRKTDEEKEVILEFEYDEELGSTQVYLNDDLLFDESADLKNDAKNRAQVLEKMDKFVFLLNEYIRKLEAELEAKQKEDEEKKQMINEFREF